MAAAADEELKLSRRFKEHLEDATFRRHLQNYLKKYEKDTKLKVLEAYERLHHQGGLADDHQLSDLIENVDGLQFNPKAKDKRLDLMEQCYCELETGINKTDFIKYIKTKKYLNF